MSGNWETKNIKSRQLGSYLSQPHYGAWHLGNSKLNLIMMYANWETNCLNLIMMPGTQEIQKLNLIS